MTASRLIGALLLSGFVVAALSAPFLPVADPLRQSLAHALDPPNDAAWLGTDHLGRSLSARVLFGARSSLGIALGATLLAVGTGGVLGVLGAMSGAASRAAIRLGVDTALALPGFLSALLIAATLGPGAAALMLAVAASSWAEPCRVALLTATQAISSPCVEAARLAGVSRTSVALRLVAPALLVPIGSVGGLMFGQAVLTVASLGFLGVGLRPPTPEWGAMIVDGLPYMTEAPLLIVVPAAAIVLTVAGLFLAVRSGPTAGAG